MSEIRFIQSAGDNLQAFCELLETHTSDEPVRIAIAFWGGGAENLFSGHEARTFEVICNLSAGGTNPRVIRAIRSMENVAVVQLDELHAKVLIADRAALVTSANASTNGLALEGVRASTWHEAGVLVPWDAAPKNQFIDWFKGLWTLAQPIEETDLDRAETTWTERKQQLSESGQSQNSDDTPDGMATFKTFGFKGRAPMKQVYIRSAAALFALRGCDGGVMPASPFKFLFSGGTTRAFKHHEDKFIEDDGGVRLKSEFIGHFVGSDGLVSSCPAEGRFKSLSDSVVHGVAAWMVGRGDLPPEIEGEVIEGKFLQHGLHRGPG